MSLETDSISTAYIQSLQEQIRLLRQICKAASAILSDDDNFETLRRRYEQAAYPGEPSLREQYHAAKAAYFRFTGRSAP